MQMNTIKLVTHKINQMQKLTSRLAETFDNLNKLVQAELQRIGGAHGQLDRNQIIHENHGNRRNLTRIQSDNEQFRVELPRENSHHSSPDPQVNLNKTRNDTFLDGQAVSQLENQIKQTKVLQNQEMQNERQFPQPKQKPRKVAKKKPNKPLSAFKLFFNETRTELLKTGTNSLSDEQIKQKIENEWQILDEVSKLKYFEKQKLENEKYQKKLTLFYQNNPYRCKQDQLTSKKNAITQKKGIKIVNTQQQQASINGISNRDSKIRQFKEKYQDKEEKVSDYELYCKQLRSQYCQSALNGSKEGLRNIQNSIMEDRFKILASAQKQPAYDHNSDSYSDSQSDSLMVNT